MALARLPLGPGVALGACVTAALAIATTLAGSSASAVFAGTLLCVVLGLVAGFMRQARESQDRTELLLAQLEDAHEAKAEAVAVAERGRIAGELHDVLAHSLSGAAIQLEGARMLAERDSTTPQMRAAIERANALVKEGLANARQAVGALKGDELPGVAGLDALIQGFKANLNVDATFRIEGIARTLPADASLALYRGAQEALTNVARYAPRASTSVVLRYDRDRTILSVENRQPLRADAIRNPIPADASRNPIPATANRTPTAPVASGGLVGVGGGRGLAGMRERVGRSGGSVQAGPTDDGWRVELQVPV
jgi:signal transduction histidine kinase